MHRKNLLGYVCALALAFAISLPAHADEPTPASPAPVAETSSLDGPTGFEYEPYNPGYWFAGTEMVFLNANVETGGRMNASFDDSGTAGTDASLLAGRGLNDVFGYAPRLWLGRQINDDWGVIGRFWFFGQSANQPISFLSPPLQNFATFSESTQVRLFTTDIEGVRSFGAGAWKFDGMLGGRFASFRAQSAFNVFGVFTTGNFINLSLGNRNDFDGAGVTYALAARRQIGDSPFYLFMSARGSNLAGIATGRSSSAGSVASNPSTPLVGAATVTRANYNATASIAELQVGLQMEYPLERLPVTAFFRTAFEYQFWDIHNKPVGGAGFGGTIGTLTTNSFSGLVGNGTANLAGVALGTGFTW